MKVVLPILAALVIAPTAQAHLPYKPKNDSVKARLHAQTLNLKHTGFVCKHGAGAHKKWSCSAKRWLQRERIETRAKLRPRIKYLASWKCIHKYEGPWNDPHAPYYGGLQMDLAFQRLYGPDLLRHKGTADNWTPYEQMMVAERAHRTRGFYPWPNTARKCGLI